MKDKRTYTHLKEHGEDMTHENESKITIDPNYREDRGPGDLSLLIEMHKKEIWEWKQKESEWIKTNNMLSGTKKIVEELSSKIIEQVRIIKQLEQEIERLLAESKK
jgi:hypothetical protein